MLRPFASVLVLLLAVHLIAGQERSDEPSINGFVGTWQLKSNIDKYLSQLPKGAVWTISVSGDEVIMEMDGYPFRMNSRLVLIQLKQILKLRPGLDGEENVIHGTRVRSNSKLRKNSIIREFQTKMTSSGGVRGTEYLYADVTEKFTLSKDGDRLTFETTSRTNSKGDGPSGHEEFPSKLIFERKD